MDKSCRSDATALNFEITATEEDGPYSRSTVALFQDQHKGASNAREQIVRCCKIHGMTLCWGFDAIGSKLQRSAYTSAIGSSAITICDIGPTHSIIFYAIGIAHAIDRNRTIILYHGDIDNSKTQAPFDIRHLRMILYAPGEEETKLAENLRLHFENILFGVDRRYEHQFSALATSLGAHFPQLLRLIVSIRGKSVGVDKIVAGRDIKESGYSIIAAPKVWQGMLNLGYCHFEQQMKAVKLTSIGEAFARFLEYSRDVKPMDLNYFTTDELMEQHICRSVSNGAAIIL